MDFQHTAEAAGKAVDAVGTVIILVGGLTAIALAARGARQRRPSIYGDFRRFFGRSILLGLEFLVAADIIRTVAVTPTLESVGVLGVIVIIRTFLSFSLELEITGRWPWQKEHPPPES